MAARYLVAKTYAMQKLTLHTPLRRFGTLHHQWGFLEASPE
jgi:hypothetical protein